MAAMSGECCGVVVVCVCVGVGVGVGKRCWTVCCRCVLHCLCGVCSGDAKFEGQTVSHEAFAGVTMPAREKGVAPRNQLQLGDANTKFDVSVGHRDGDFDDV